MAIPNTILQLSEKYSFFRDAYIHEFDAKKYNEAHLRADYLDPFFKSMNWDINNEKGSSEAYREVLHGEPVRIHGTTKFFDYTFRVGGVRKFIVEAKKPSIRIKDDTDAALQLRWYAWNQKLPLSILTNFEEFAVYDCTKKPETNDAASVARIEYFTYKEYPDKWDWIVSIFSQDSILRGSFDKFAEQTKGKRGTTNVDDDILVEIETWRDGLAKNIALRNKLTVEELNAVVQRTIDRIIFLRICEDRGIEEYGALQSFLEFDHVYARLCDLFQQADDKYNSGLFHFRQEPGWEEPLDILSLSITLDDKVLKEIIKRLYFPNCQYIFSVIPPAILGHVYEQFLGKVIRLTEGGYAKVEYKPEVKKAGGVYYTPEYIVNYIVRNTVAELVKGKTPREVSKIHILDPACGSGSFLIGAYQFLLDWHLEWYTTNLAPLLNKNKTIADPEVRDLLPEPASQRKKKGIFTESRNLPIYSTGLNKGVFDRDLRRSDYILNTTEKKRILLNNIYGVDIDSQAVEVTKLSLLLKVLEEENKDTVDVQRKITQERALPNLDQNIKCGNSLIGWDILIPGMPTDEVKHINPFDWDKEFSDIMKGGGFDVVIGNPPYVFGGNFGIEQNFKKYFKDHFFSGSGKINLFTLFIEKSANILRDGGYLSFIIPNTLLRVTSYVGIREFMLKKTAIKKIVDMGVGVFSGATTSSVIIVLERNKDISENKIEIRMGIDGVAQLTHQSDFLNTGYVLNIKATSQDTSLLDKLSDKSINLGELCEELIFGVVITKNRDEVVSNKPLKGYKPFLEGRDISRYIISPVEKYLLYKPELLHRPRTPRIFEALEKILIQRITGGARPLKAAYDNQQYYNKESINNIILKDDSIYNIKYVLGLINSRLLSWFYNNKFTNESTLTVNLSKTYLSQLPIRTVDFSNPIDKTRHDRMVLLVSTMLDLNKKLQDAKLEQEMTLLSRQIEATDDSIDKLVYELYDLTEEEIKIIEGIDKE